jgi:histidinol dehydrogenase
LATAVQDSLTVLVNALPPEAAARKSLARNGYIICAVSLDEAAEIANRKAPEHLELALAPGAARDRLAQTVHNFGSLFVGHRSAEVLGDYAAGLNHTLPTSGSALFTGGLSVRHFLKTVTTLRVAEGEAAELSGWEASARAAETLAMAEGLTAHALAARYRLPK